MNSLFAMACIGRNDDLKDKGHQMTTGSASSHRRYAFFLVFVIQYLILIHHELAHGDHLVQKTPSQWNLHEAERPQGC